MRDGGERPKYLQRFRGLSSNVLALSLVSLLNDTSSEIIYPLLPAFLVLTLGASPFAIGLIEGLAESVASILKLFSGYLSDKFGTRKLPVFIGYALAAITRPFLSFVTTWPQVLVVRTADRVGKGIRGSPRDALIAASVPETERGFAFGFNRAADNMGAVLGPLVGFILLYFIARNADSPTAREYQQVFLYASIPVVLGLLVIVGFVHEKDKSATANGGMPIRFSLGTFDSKFKLYLGIVALFTLSNSSDAFLLLRAEQSGIAPVLLPLLWVVLNVSKVVSSLIGGHLSDTIGRRPMIVSGWIVYALVYVGFAFVGSAWEAWALFIVYGTYFGLTEGTEKALVADMVSEDKRGTAYGFYNLAIGITVLPASLLFGLVWDGFGAPTAFIASAVVSIVSALLLVNLKLKK
jgi:MFS family permease